MAITKCCGAPWILLQMSMLLVLSTTFLGHTDALSVHLKAEQNHKSRSTNYLDHGAALKMLRSAQLIQADGEPSKLQSKCDTLSYILLSMADNNELYVLAHNARIEAGCDLLDAGGMDVSVHESAVNAGCILEPYVNLDYQMKYFGNPYEKPSIAKMQSILTSELAVQGDENACQNTLCLLPVFQELRDYFSNLEMISSDEATAITARKKRRQMKYLVVVASHGLRQYCHGKYTTEAIYTETESEFNKFIHETQRKVCNRKSFSSEVEDAIQSTKSGGESTFERTNNYFAGKLKWTNVFDRYGTDLLYGCCAAVEEQSKIYSDSLSMPIADELNSDATFNTYLSRLRRRIRSSLELGRVMICDVKPTCLDYCRTVLDSMGLVDKGRYLSEEPFDFDGQDETVKTLYADVPTYIYKPGEPGYPGSSLNCDLERSLLAAAQTDLDTISSSYIQTHVSGRYIEVMHNYMTNLTETHTLNVNMCVSTEGTAGSGESLVQHTSSSRTVASRLSQRKELDNQHAQRGRVHVLAPPQGKVNGADVAGITRDGNHQQGEKAPASVGTDNEAAGGGNSQDPRASVRTDGDRGEESSMREIVSEITMQETKILTPDQVLGQ